MKDYDIFKDIEDGVTTEVIYAYRQGDFGLHPNANRGAATVDFSNGTSATVRGVPSGFEVDPACSHGTRKNTLLLNVSCDHKLGCGFEGADYIQARLSTTIVYVHGRPAKKIRHLRKFHQKIFLGLF